MSQTGAAVDRAVNVADLVRRQAADRPDKVAVVEAASERSLTWSALDAAVDSLANGMSAAGLVAGQRVAFVLPNRLSFVVGYLAVARAGLVAVPLNPLSSTGELVRMLVDSGSRLVMADVTTVASVRAAVGGLEDALAGADERVRRQTPSPTLVVDGCPPLPGEQAYNDLAAGGGRRVVSPADRENVAALLYTSGTSGTPRAAMLSHRALLANIAQVGAIEPAATLPEDVVLGLLPLFHVYGLNVVLGQVVATGARLVLVDGFDGFDAEQTLRVVVDHAVTSVPIAPPVVAQWVEQSALPERLANVRMVVSGAAPLDVSLRARFTEITGAAIEHGYGMTEAAPVVTSTLCSGGRAAGYDLDPAGVGGPLPGVEIQVREAHGTVVIDDPGQVFVRGDNLFSGYWPDGGGGPGSDGWWATGDVGLVDRHGDLVLLDRVQELVLVSGFHVYPTEVEDVVSELPEVAEVAVIGVPDEATGQAVVAFVVAVGGGPDPVRLQHEVRARCEQRLARYKCPREVAVVTDLPRSATGSVAKGRLRMRARHELLGLT